jgi:S-adenosylmethionine hydrolase
MIITLLSDFGYQDNFIAVAKGVLLQKLPVARLIDLNHEVEPFHLLQCSYLLKSAYSNFPANTVHLSLFDIMHQNPASLLVTRVQNQFVVGADNGLLPLTFNGQIETVYALPDTVTSYIDWLHLAANYIEQLQQNDFRIGEMKTVSPKVHPMQLQPLIKENGIECQVIHIDRYENVVINITRDEFESLRKGRRFRIAFMRNEAVTQISDNYSDVAPGEKLCLFNSAGFLEIAINQGKASSLLGLRLYNERQLIYQNIKIEFL